jgi:hypothetical protein
MGDVKWPSFVIQGIILATITTYLIKGGGYINTWMFMSLLLVLGLFSLQTTSLDFLYLYRVVNNQKAPNYKTHILRITTMVSIVCLYMGIYHPNNSLGTLTDSPISQNGQIVTLIIAVVFLLVVPLLFNFIKNK